MTWGCLLGSLWLSRQNPLVLPPPDSGNEVSDVVGSAQRLRGENEFWGPKAPPGGFGIFGVSAFVSHLWSDGLIAGRFQGKYGVRDAGEGSSAAFGRPSVCSSNVATHFYVFWNVCSMFQSFSAWPSGDCKDRKFHKHDGFRRSWVTLPIRSAVGDTRRVSLVDPICCLTFPNCIETEAVTLHHLVKELREGPAMRVFSGTGSFAVDATWLAVYFWQNSRVILVSFKFNVFRCEMFQDIVLWATDGYRNSCLWNNGFLVLWWQDWTMPFACACMALREMFAERPVMSSYLRPCS